MEYQPTNRDKSRNAKLGKFWCISCDAQLIGKEKKCPVCGKYSNRQKHKKKIKKFI